MFLSRLWFTYDGSLNRGAQCNILLDILLQGLFVNIKMSNLKNYLECTLKEISVLKAKDDTLKSFPCFYK